MSGQSQSLRSSKARACRLAERGLWYEAKDMLRAAQEIDQRPRPTEARKMGRLARKKGAAAENADLTAFEDIVGARHVKSWRRREAANITTGADYQIDHPAGRLLVQRKFRKEIHVREVWTELMGAWHHGHNEYCPVVHAEWSRPPVRDPKTGQLAKSKMDLAILTTSHAILMRRAQPLRQLFLWEVSEAHRYDLAAISVRRLWEKAQVAVVDTDYKSYRDATPSFAVRLTGVDEPLCFYDWGTFFQDYLQLVMVAEGDETHGLPV